MKELVSLTMVAMGTAKVTFSVIIATITRTENVLSKTVTLYIRTNTEKLELIG